MKLSAKARYGIQALVVMASGHPDRRPIRVQELARDCGAPQKYLVQILQDLRRADLVEGVRGNGGGYRLRADPAKVTLKDVLALLEGPVIAATDPHGGTGLGRVLEPVWRRVDEAVGRALSGVTFADLAERWVHAPGPMYYI